MFSDLTNFFPLLRPKFEPFFSLLPNTKAPPSLITKPALPGSADFKLPELECSGIFEPASDSNGFRP